MSFKDNLKKKITINRLALSVLNSFRPPGSIQKVDLDSMRTLLKMSAYKFREERDLDLYYKAQMTETPRIVVLDNELPLYCTSIEDVILRKNPTVKEMISIKNAIRILNDKDVLVSKREETVHTVQNEGIALLDLSCEASDLEALENDGLQALKNNQPEIVLEHIELFAEMLRYRALPPHMLSKTLHGVGFKAELKDKKILWGPLIIYNPDENKLKLMVDQFDGSDKDTINLLRQIAEGTRTADLEDGAVFEFLKKSVVPEK